MLLMLSKTAYSFMPNVENVPDWFQAGLKFSLSNQLGHWASRYFYELKAECDFFCVFYNLF
jgi:hypothetical protein